MDAAAELKHALRLTMAESAGSEHPAQPAAPGAGLGGELDLRAMMPPPTHHPLHEPRWRRAAAAQAAEAAAAHIPAPAYVPPYIRLGLTAEDLDHLSARLLMFPPMPPDLAESIRQAESRKQAESTRKAESVSQWYSAQAAKAAAAHIPAPAHIAPTAGDLAHLLIALTFAQKVPLEEGVKHEVDWEVARRGDIGGTVVVYGSLVRSGERNLSVGLVFPSLRDAPSKKQVRQLEALEGPGDLIIRDDDGHIRQVQCNFPGSRNRAAAQDMLAKLICIEFDDNLTPLLLRPGKPRVHQKVLLGETTKPPPRNVLELRLHSTISASVARSLLMQRLPCLSDKFIATSGTGFDGTTGALFQPRPEVTGDHFDLTFIFQNVRPKNKAIYSLAARLGIDADKLQFDGAQGEHLGVRLPGQRDLLRRFLLALHLELIKKPFALDYTVIFTLPGSIVCTTSLSPTALSPALAIVADQMNVSSAELALFLAEFQ